MLPENLQARLQELRSEYQNGEAQLASLDAKRVEMRDLLLRISGAIQVLEEMLQIANASAALPETPVTDA